MKHLFFFALFLVISIGSSGAQTPAANSGSSLPALPDPPLALRVPDFSEWKIIYTYKDGDKGDQVNPELLKNPAIIKALQSDPNALFVIGHARIKQIEFIKTKNIIHILISYAHNFISDRWLVNHMTMSKKPGQPKISIAFGSDGPDYIDLSQTDFPDVQWVSSNNFIGEKMQGAHKCYAFRQGGASAPSSGTASKNAAAPGSGTVAEIDEASHLPIFLQIDENKSCVYQFGSPPDAMLELPPEFKEVYDAIANQEKAFSKKAAIRTVTKSGSPTNP